jgi:hypothetical protein
MKSGINSGYLKMIRVHCEFLNKKIFPSIAGLRGFLYFSGWLILFCTKRQSNDYQSVIKPQEHSSHRWVE